MELTLNLFSSDVYVIYPDANCTRVVHEVVLNLRPPNATAIFNFPLCFSSLCSL